MQSGSSYLRLIDLTLGWRVIKKEEKECEAPPVREVAPAGG